MLLGPLVPEFSGWNPMPKLFAALYRRLSIIHSGEREKGNMFKAIISLILVGIFLYLTVTAIQRFMEAGEDVEQTKKESRQAQQEADQARLEFEQTADEYIQAENERNTRIAKAQERLDQAQSNFEEVQRKYSAEVAQRTSEGCVPKEYSSGGHVNTWSCPAP